MKSAETGRRERPGMVSGGRLCGTSPTMATPRSARPRPRPRAVVTTTAATGPALARCRPALGPRPRDQERLQPLAHPEQEPGRRDADDQRDPVDVAQMRVQRAQDLGQRVAMRLDPRMCLSWLVGDQDARRGDEARDHRVAEEIGEKAQPQHPIAAGCRPTGRPASARRPRSRRALLGHLPTAAAVISETTATGPTASARLVPKIA
jgi:hypothetical protein